MESAIKYYESQVALGFFFENPDSLTDPEVGTAIFNKDAGWRWEPETCKEHGLDFNLYMEGALESRKHAQNTERAEEAQENRDELHGIE